MIILGLVLIVVGAAVAYFFPDQLARFAGVVLLVLGLILVLLGVLDTGDVDVNEGTRLVRSSWGKFA